MIKKIDVLGLSLDNYTVREAIRQVETYLSNDVLNTIECISMEMLIQAEEDEVLRSVIQSLDLAVIGEKEILQATKASSMQRIRETEENDFFFEFFKRIERNRKSVFLIGESKETVEELKSEMEQEFGKIVIAGSYATEECVGALDAIINEMNATTPDVIVSVLPTPEQEHFFWEHKEKMNANIWYGMGKIPIRRKHGMVGFIQRIVHRGKLKSSILKYTAKCEAKNE